MCLFEFINECENLLVNHEDVVIYGFDDEHDEPAIIYEGAYWDIPYCFLTLDFTSMFISDENPSMINIGVECPFTIVDDEE